MVAWRGLADAEQRLAHELRLLQNSMVGVRALSLMDGQGRVIVSSRAQLLEHDYGAQTWITQARSALQAGQLWISPPVPAALSAGTIVLLARSVPTVDGSFAGMLTASLDPQALHHMFDAVRFAPDIVAVMAHGSGRGVLRLGPTEGLSPDANLREPGSLWGLHQASGQPASVQERRLTTNGAPIVMALRTVAPPELSLSQTLVIGVGRERSSMLAHWRTLVWVLAGVYLLSALAAMAGSWVVQRRRRALLAQMAQAQVKEKRWQAVMEIARQGVWEWSADRQQLFLSPIWKTMLGYTEQEVGDSLHEWRSRLHPEERAALRAQIKNYLQGGQSVFDAVHRMRRKDGSYQWVQTTGRAIERDAQGQPTRIVGVQTDATEQHRLRERIDRLLENLPGALYEIVLERDGRSHMPYASPGALQVYGVTPAQVREDAAAMIAHIHPADRDAFLHSTAVSARQLTLWQQDFRVQCPGQELRWVRGIARPQAIEQGAVRWYGYSYDITESHQVRERLDRIAENVPGLLYQYQMEPDGRSFFPYASKGAETIYELTPAQMRESVAAVFDRIHPDDMAAGIAAIETSARELTLWAQEYRVRLPQRGERWLRAQAHPERLESGATRWHGYIDDITETKLLARQLAETERMLRHLMNDLPVGLCMVDEQRRIYFRNRRFYDYFGHAAESTPTLHEWTLKAYPDPAYRSDAGQRWRQALALARAQGGEILAEDYRITAHDGSERVVSIGGLLFGQHFLATFVDQTEQRAQQEFLRKLAYLDGLTGVANRRQFDEQLQTEWRRCGRSQQPLALLMIDIDDFKRYNDRYGHQQGDHCLQAVAQALAAVVGRGHDLLARYGGEEFACLLPDCDLDGARSVALNMAQAVRALNIEHLDSRGLPIVSVSIGVASVIPSVDGPPDALLARADDNLYRAKTMGRNGVQDGIAMLQK